MRRWLLCLLGRHEWVVFDDVLGQSYVFCLYCGESDS